MSTNIERQSDTDLTTITWYGFRRVPGDLPGNDMLSQSAGRLWRFDGALARMVVHQPLHSQTGLSWGHISDACRDTALSLLLNSGLKFDEALERYERFADEVVAEFPVETFTYTGRELSVWLNQDDVRRSKIAG